MMLLVSDIERMVLAEPIYLSSTNAENKRITQRRFFSFEYLYIKNYSTIVVAIFGIKKTNHRFF